MRRFLCLVCSFLIAVSAFAEFGSQDSANLSNIELMLNANTPFVRSQSDDIGYIKDLLRTNGVDYTRYLNSITNVLWWFDKNNRQSTLSAFLFNSVAEGQTGTFKAPGFYNMRSSPGINGNLQEGAIDNIYVENSTSNMFRQIESYHQMFLQRYPTLFASINNFLYHIYNSQTNYNASAISSLSSIENISSGGTNILHDILTTLQTNKTEITAIGITNLIDYTSILESISRDVSEIPDEISNGLDELGSTVEQSVGKVYTNQLAIIGGVASISNDTATIAQTSIASTNIESAIKKRLDGWDYFYNSFTNGNLTFPQIDISYYRLDYPSSSTPSLTWGKLSPFKNRTFIQVLAQSLTQNIRSLGSLNNYAYDYYQYYHTNGVPTNLLNLYNSFSDYANIYTNSTLSYILNPSSYSRANIYTPMYFYKGTGNNVPVQTQQLAIQPDLEGFSYNINKYIPNTLASVNNYLYDFFNNGVKVSNFPSFNFTNIVNVATTNNVEVEVVSTNSLDKWEVIAGWLETYSSSSASADFLASAVVYDSFSDLSSTNTSELEEISATGDFLQDMYNSQQRINQLLSNINKSLMMQGAGSDQLSEISSAQEEMEAQSETLKSLVDGSDLVPTINSEVENALNLPDLPTVQDTELPEVITLSIPDLLHPTDFYDLEIETDKVASILSSVRAFFRFVWWSLLALLFWFVLRVVLRMALRLAKFISTLKVY